MWKEATGGACKAAGNCIHAILALNDGCRPREQSKWGTNHLTPTNRPFRDARFLRVLLVSPHQGTVSLSSAR